MTYPSDMKPRITVQHLLEGLWMVSIPGREEGLHCFTLRSAFYHVLEALKNNRYNVFAMGKNHSIYLSIHLVKALASNFPLWWEYDGIAFTLRARTVLNENGSIRTRRLNQYSTERIAVGFHTALVELGANIRPDALERARQEYYEHENFDPYLMNRVKQVQESYHR